MCKAIDVAAYILNERGRLSGYQLQKLLYYSQAWCLVTQGRRLFAEEIRAWEHGPVVYEVARASRPALRCDYRFGWRPTRDLC